MKIVLVKKKIKYNFFLFNKIEILGSPIPFTLYSR
jgi:hypothetical protein